MKEIKAYIRPQVLDAAIRDLEAAGAQDITVIRVDAIGAAVDETDHHLVSKYATKYSAIAKLEIVCRDDDASRFMEIVRRDAHTGASGDGRIFLSNIDSALNIRNGRTGAAAL